MLSLYNHLANELNRALITPTYTDLHQGYLAPSSDELLYDDRAELTLDLPGVKKENFDIKVAGRKLTLSWKNRKGEQMDRTYQLAEKVNLTAISASYEDGVLTVKLPYTAESAPRSIQVS